MWALIPLVLASEPGCSEPVACLAGRTTLACDDWCWSLRSAGEAACNNAYKVNDASLGATWSATGTQGPRACYWHSATSTCKWASCGHGAHGVRCCLRPSNWWTTRPSPRKRAARLCMVEFLLRSPSLVDDEAVAAEARGEALHEEDGQILASRAASVTQACKFDLLLASAVLATFAAPRPTLAPR